LNWPQTESLFWCVALGFYLFDTIRLVPPRSVLVRGTLTGGLDPLINLSGYQLNGKDVVVPQLLLPSAPIFRLRCDPALRSSPSDLEAAERRLRGYRRTLRPFGWLSMASLLVLICGPVLTYQYGLTSALLVLAPIHALIFLAVAFLMIVRRDRLGLGWPSCLLLLFEALVVPAYLACTLRRLASRLAFLDADGFALCLRQEREISESPMAYRIASKLDSLMLAHEPGQAVHQRYLDYKKWLGV
jgi:hypothetical protein